MKVGKFFVVLVMVLFDISIFYAMWNAKSFGVGLFAFIFFVILTFSIYAILKYEFSSDEPYDPAMRHKYTMRYLRVGERPLDFIQEEIREQKRRDAFMREMELDRNIETQAILASEDEVYVYDESDEMLRDFEEFVDDLDHAGYDVYYSDNEVEDAEIREDVDADRLSPIDKARLGSNTHGFKR